eukprot:scaffold63588_cov59-Phaeocystis_antarctica.AAC.3
MRAAIACAGVRRLYPASPPGFDSALPLDPPELDRPSLLSPPLPPLPPPLPLSAGFGWLKGVTAALPNRSLSCLGASEFAAVLGAAPPP